MAKDKIRIRNMVFYAFHGIEKQEQERGQRFEVDVELHLNLKEAGQSDDLSDTIDYREVYKKVEDLVLDKQYNLIEALSEDIAQTLLENFEAIEGVVVRVRKPHAVLEGITGGVEVEISRVREPQG